MTLPTDADFAGGSPRLSASYSRGRARRPELLQRHGRPAVLQAYRAIGARRGVPAEAALADALRGARHHASSLHRRLARRPATAARMSRRAPAVVLAALLVALGVALALTVPWTPLPGAHLTPDPSRDFTRRADRPRGGLPRRAAAELVRLARARPGRRRRARCHPHRRPARAGGGTTLRWRLGLAGAVRDARRHGCWSGWSHCRFGARSESVLREYGLSTQTWSSWSLDVVRSVLVDAGLNALALLALVGLAPDRPAHLVGLGAGRRRRCSS